MNMKLSFKIFLICLIAFAKAQETNLTCTKELVESYGIISYDQAKKERLIFCPNVQYTCCPAYEQFKIYETYSKRVKPGFVALYEIIKKEIKLLETEVTAVLKSGLIETAIASIKEKPIQMRLMFAYSKIKPMKPEKIFKKLKQHHAKSSTYVAAWKSSFFCTICDFPSQSYFNIGKKTITYNSASCDAFVQNTLLFVNLLNNVVIKLLSGLTEIIARLSKTTKFQKLHNFRRILKAIKECVGDYKQFDSGLGACKDYCELFNLAKDNYVFEGYPELFANTLVTIRGFMPKSASKSGNATAPASNSTTPAAAQPPKRNLIEVAVRNLLQKSKIQNQEVYHKNKASDYFEVNLPKFTKFKGLNDRRILAEIVNFNEFTNAEKEQKLLERKRILQETEIAQDWRYDPLDPRLNTTYILDIFTKEANDKHFDENKINKMVEVHNIFNSGNPQETAKLMKRFFAENYLAETGNLEDKTLFLQTSTKTLSIADFATKFNFNGINLHAIAWSMNWGISYKHIELSLTSSGSAEIELISSDLLKYINTISDWDIKKFHLHQRFTFRKQHTQLQEETIDILLRNYALQRLRNIIAEKVMVYKYLLENFGTTDANKVWEQIELLNRQYELLSVGSSNIKVDLTQNQASSIQNVASSDPANPDAAQNSTAPGMNIISTNDTSGKITTTRIPNIQEILNDNYVTIFQEDFEVEKRKSQELEENRNKTKAAALATNTKATVPATPAIKRQLRQLTKKLKAKHHEVLKSSKNFKKKIGRK